jgi:hypothetical protein
VKELNGTMTIGRAAERGTTLAVRLPLQSLEDALARAAG